MKADLFVFVFVRVDEGLKADVQELSSLAPRATGAQLTSAGPSPPETF